MKRQRSSSLDDHKRARLPIYRERISELNPNLREIGLDDTRCDKCGHVSFCSKLYDPFKRRDVSYELCVACKEKPVHCSESNKNIKPERKWIEIDPSDERLDHGILCVEFEFHEYLWEIRDNDDMHLFPFETGATNATENLVCSALRRRNRQRRVLYFVPRMC